MRHLVSTHGSGRAPGRSQAGPDPLGGSGNVPVDRGVNMTRAERRAAPKPARIPSGIGQRTR